VTKVRNYDNSGDYFIGAVSGSGNYCFLMPFPNKIEINSKADLFLVAMASREKHAKIVSNYSTQSI
jgi:hypothetical protein